MAHQPPEALELAQVLWNYHCLDTGLPESADVIVALGSNDERTAQRAADLWLSGRAPLVVMSGNTGKHHRSDPRPEAETYRNTATAKGVPSDCILTEARSTNTGENIRFTRSLLDERRTLVATTILVCKPYMQRRSWATAMRQWPNVRHYVSAPLLSFSEFPDQVMTERSTIELMVGDLQSIADYPARGFQIEQEIPADVWAAYESLRAMGYTRYLK